MAESDTPNGNDVAAAAVAEAMAGANVELPEKLVIKTEGKVGLDIPQPSAVLNVVSAPVPAPPVTKPEPPISIATIKRMHGTVKQISDKLDALEGPISIDLSRARDSCRATMNWLSMASRPTRKP